MVHLNTQIDFDTVVYNVCLLSDNKTTYRVFIILVTYCKLLKGSSFYLFRVVEVITFVYLLVVGRAYCKYIENLIKSFFILILNEISFSYVQVQPAPVTTNFSKSL